MTPVPTKPPSVGIRPHQPAPKIRRLLQLPSVTLQPPLALYMFIVVLDNSEQKLTLSCTMTSRGAQKCTLRCPSRFVIIRGPAHEDSEKVSRGTLTSYTGDTAGWDEDVLPLHPPLSPSDEAQDSGG